MSDMDDQVFADNTDNANQPPVNDELWSALRQRGLEILKMIQDDEAAVRENWRAQAEPAAYQPPDVPADSTLIDHPLDDMGGIPPTHPSSSWPGDVSFDGTAPRSADPGDAYRQPFDQYMPPADDYARFDGDYASASTDSETSIGQDGPYAADPTPAFPHFVIPAPDHEPGDDAETEPPAAISAPQDRLRDLIGNMSESPVVPPAVDYPGPDVFPSDIDPDAITEEDEEATAWGQFRLQTPDRFSDDAFVEEFVPNAHVDVPPAPSVPPVVEPEPSDVDQAQDDSAEESEPTLSPLDLSDLYIPPLISIPHTVPAADDIADLAADSAPDDVSSFVEALSTPETSIPEPDSLTPDTDEAGPDLDVGDEPQAPEPVDSEPTDDQPLDLAPMRPVEYVTDGTDPEEWDLHEPSAHQIDISPVDAQRAIEPPLADEPGDEIVPEDDTTLAIPVHVDSSQPNAWDVQDLPGSEDIFSETLPPDRYSDRELSWLAFNNRVLDLARDKKRVPLLERAKFLAIFSSNLDEFFMVRVAGLKRRMDAGMAQPGTSGLLPRELHEAILSSSRDLVAEQSRVFVEEVLPELADKGIRILHWDELTDSEKARLDTLFNEKIFPILTPLAVDSSHPFPYISGLSLNLAVQLRNPSTGQRLFARIKVPNVLNRFLEVTESRFVPLEDVISSHLDTIFTGMEVVHSTTFRVTRNEDLEVEEDDAENILFALEKELLRRKVGRPPVRLEVEEGIDSELLDTLAHELDVTTQEIFFIKGPLDLTGLFGIADVDREDLKYPSFLPKTNPQLAEVETSMPADMFGALKKHDVLLHHPYDSFATSVQRFIEQAAADPQVLAIKQTLYRTSGDSPIVDALIEAARAGKQVLALVEIKARFDERANIAWARKLEKAGVHVVYGLVGLKTHCKLSLVIRDEGETLRRYCHIGTGNYNPKTARTYEDMGLLTADPVITDDVARLFNHLSGLTAESTYSKLLVSPFGIRNGLIAQIKHEIELAKAGRPARIRIKVNSIVDEATMDALYYASHAGVKVDLWVRGICAMRSDVPDWSENIRVRSILGRFLEHSRLFWFDNDGDPVVGIGSADLMHRNLDRRVETLVRLENEAHIQQIGNLFDLAFDEQTASWWLTEDGWVQKTATEDGTALRDLQEYLIHSMGARRTNVS